MTPQLPFDADPDLSPWHGAAGREPDVSFAGGTDLLLAWLPEGGGSAASWDRFFAAPPLPLRTAPGPVAPPPIADVWDAGGANSAVDCLFRFFHALERRDAGEAMACISPSYHTFEEGQDIDREMLRRKLEYVFDLWRTQEVRLSMEDTPEPVFHPAGILIDTVLRIDSRLPGEGWRTQSLHRVAVFEEIFVEGWLIVALSDPEKA
jgi:hypothetical protein